MCLLFSLSSAFLLVSVLALNPSQTLINLTPGPSSVNLSTTALASGNSTPILEWSTKNVSDDLEIACNSRFGTDLTYTSCSDAIASFQVPFTGYLTIGPRDDERQYNFNLPWRWISGDGRCIFDIIKDRDVEYGMATAAELIHAATSLIDTCIGERNGLGGSVFEVGFDGGMGMAMRAFDPSQIQCGEAESNPPFEDNCEELEQKIPAAASPLLIFGPPGGRGVTHSFPATYLTKPPAGCILLIEKMDGLPASTIDTSTYYEMWEDIVAIQGMCVRQNHPGRRVSAGDNGRLELWLFEYHGQETALGANLTIGNQTVATPVIGNNTQNLGLSSEPLPSAVVESS
ncbi:hypothetical protein ABVK25_004723 [Lepraria finkii]|uniref:Ecp2 effector protein domain-containing protein n=1 Tax=Lepraria finkii TaxID=1340010 RepID=A0ABR4BDG7_9LECA